MAPLVLLCLFGQTRHLASTTTWLLLDLVGTASPALGLGLSTHVDLKRKDGQHVKPVYVVKRDHSSLLKQPGHGRIYKELRVAGRHTECNWLSLHGEGHHGVALAPPL